MIADPFPVLNALQEMHLLLAEGAHNQFGDLPWTARHEMLMQQWLLARPEFREFLPQRVDGRLSRAVDGPRRRDEARCRAGRTPPCALPRPRRLRRAAAALDPLRRLEQRRSTASRPATGRATGARRCSGTSTRTAPSRASTCRRTCRTSAARAATGPLHAARLPPPAPARPTAPAAPRAALRRRPRAAPRAQDRARAGRGLRAPRRAARPPTAHE